MKCSGPKEIKSTFRRKKRFLWFSSSCFFYTVMSPKAHLIMLSLYFNVSLSNVESNILSQKHVHVCHQSCSTHPGVALLCGDVISSSLCLQGYNACGFPVHFNFKEDVVMTVNRSNNNIPQSLCQQIASILFNLLLASDPPWIFVSWKAVLDYWMYFGCSSWTMKQRILLQQPSNHCSLFSVFK